MHQLQRFGIFLVQIDTRNTGIMHLLEKLLHVRAPLVPHPGIGKQTATAPGLEYPDAEIDVLAKTHFGKASQPAVDFRPDSHVEGARIELIHFLLPHVTKVRSFLAVMTVLSSSRQTYRYRNPIIHVCYCAIL